MLNVCTTIKFLKRKNYQLTDRNLKKKKLQSPFKYLTIWQSTPILGFYFHPHSTFIFKVVDFLRVSNGHYLLKQNVSLICNKNRLDKN